jgi:hypothetical protein
MSREESRGEYRPETARGTDRIIGPNRLTLSPVLMTHGALLTADAV